MNEPPNPPVAADECAGGRCYIANDAVMLCRWHEEQQREDATPPSGAVANPPRCACPSRCCEVPCRGLCGCQCHSDPSLSDDSAQEATDG